MKSHTKGETTDVGDSAGAVGEEGGARRKPGGSPGGEHPRPTEERWGGLWAVLAG